MRNGEGPLLEPGPRPRLDGGVGVGPRRPGPPSPGHAPPARLRGRWLRDLGLTQATLRARLLGRSYGLWCRRRRRLLLGVLINNLVLAA